MVGSKLNRQDKRIWMKKFITFRVEPLLEPDITNVAEVEYEFSRL